MIKPSHLARLKSTVPNPTEGQRAGVGTGNGRYIIYKYTKGTWVKSVDKS